jgi:peptidyl-prolyl cis-trans isomerase D
MSIIQTIRDKGARIAVFLIALALTGFILTDYLTGRSSSLFGGGPSTTVGKVNGQKIDVKEFEKKLALREKSNQDKENEPRSKFVNELWDLQVNQILVQQECDKLGLTVGPKEKNDLIYGPQPHQYLKQLFYGDANTAQYDPAAVAQEIQRINKSNVTEDKDRLNEVLEAAYADRLSEKYKYLIAGSIHYPKWVIEKQNADNSLMARISYIVIPSSVIPDTAKELVITDNEIEDYMKKRDVYKLPEETRTIEYLRFDATPSAADSSAVFKQVELLKDTFTKAKDPAIFLARNGSSFAYDSNFHPQSKIMVPAKDTIFKLPKDGVYGPYLDPGQTVSNYVLAKLIDVRSMPDSVKARHILVQTAVPQQGGQMQVILPDSIAKKKIDSIETALKHGARFDSLAKKLSDDKGSAMFGGLLRMATQRGDTSDYFTQGQMVKAFNDSCFMGKVGDIKKVKSEFGYHLIEILDQKHFEVNYKIAYMAKPIEASDETENTAANNAMQFAAASRDLKSFEENVQKQKLQKLIAPDMNEHEYQLRGVGFSRDFVKAVFDADKGEVIKPQEIKDQRKNTINVIAVVTEINKAGWMSVAKARKIIEPALKNQKKGEIIKKAIGSNISSLESVADAMNKLYHPLDTIKISTEDSLRFEPTRGSRVASEPKLLGAGFNTANNNKIIPEPIIGNYGNVFVGRVDNLAATPVQNTDINQQRKGMEQQSRQAIIYNFLAGYGQRPFDPAAVLKKTASIKDYRTKLNY